MGKGRVLSLGDVLNYPCSRADGIQGSEFNNNQKHTSKVVNL